MNCFARLTVTPTNNNKWTSDIPSLWTKLCFCLKIDFFQFLLLSLCPQNLAFVPKYCFARLMGCSPLSPLRPSNRAPMRACSRNIVIPQGRPLCTHGALEQVRPTNRHQTEKGNRIEWAALNEPSSNEHHCSSVWLRAISENITYTHT